MSKTPRPAVAAKRASRGDVRYLISAAALVIIVAVLALVFGIVRPPTLEGLTDAQRAALPAASRGPSSTSVRAAPTSLSLTRATAPSL